MVTLLPFRAFAAVKSAPPAKTSVNGRAVAVAGVSGKGFIPATSTQISTTFRILPKSRGRYLQRSVTRHPNISSSFNLFSGATVESATIRAKGLWPSLKVT